ncbi:beta-ketoacyl-ACP reductase [uncultured Arcticibacterium sp.]|uniref:beta-ketoacyl-ACP reductase n=1 Tax=uncultured Arcticibacterium sp. TaxID=2173042 RepID=UPI0030F800A3
MRLKDKVAIVTGGARGIGKATAELFVKEGAQVIIWDVLENGAETANAIGANCVFQKVDVKDLKSIEAAVSSTISQFGKIDILVNNAGILRDKSFLKMSQEEWQSVIDINLTGVFNCTKAVVPHMVEKKYGRVICTSSVVGITGGFGQTNYVASKAAIIGMVKTWAKEFGKHNITANAVAPGFIKTDMTDSIPEEIRNGFMADIPVRRLGEPADIANAYLFLATEEASYVSGHTLSVNGGVA